MPAINTEESPHQLPGEVWVGQDQCRSKKVFVKGSEILEKSLMKGQYPARPKNFLNFVFVGWGVAVGDLGDNAGVK